MRGFVGVSDESSAEEAVSKATAGLKKADLLILIAPFSKISRAAELLGERYPGTPMIGTSGESIAKGSYYTDAVTVIGLAGVCVRTGLIEHVRTAPVQSMPEFLENLQDIEPGDSDTLCLEFITGSEERVLSTVRGPLRESGVSLIGASAYGVSLGEKHVVVKDGRIYPRSCVYAFVKNMHGTVRVYKENIYTRMSRRAHFASLTEPGTKTLFQLDGIPALALYQQETGIPAEDIVSAMPHHPLGRALGDDTCIIQTMSADRNGVMFNGKAIYENDSIYIMQPGDYRNIHEDLLSRIGQNPVSFALGFDSVNRLRLFAEEGYLSRYTESLRTAFPSACFAGDGQQSDNQHMNQTLLLAVFE